MRIGHGLALFAVGAVVAAGLPVMVGSAAAAPPATIHVSKDCHLPPDGSVTRPYCSIGDALAVVVPGQTVEVRRAVYNESVVVPAGEPGRPITIKAVRESNGIRTQVVGLRGPAFRLTGVHDVVIDGFDIGGTSGGYPSAVVEGSSDVTITNGWATANSSVAAVEITGDSHRVTVSSTVVRGHDAAVISVGAGATDTLLTGNSVYLHRFASRAAAITVADAPRTTVTNNTIVADCVGGVAVSGASAGFGLYNTIIRTTWTDRPGVCLPPYAPDPKTAIPVSVAGAAATDSHVDYNVVDPSHGGDLYSWAGTAYPSQAAFTAATGQGGHDIVTDAKMVHSVDPYATGWSLAADSPAIDSALATAPGLLGRDLRDHPHADDPDVPNAGGGYVDRGSAEIIPDPKISATLTRAPGGGSLEAVATARTIVPWATDGPIGTYIFEGPGDPRVGYTTSSRFTFAKAGVACVTVTVTSDGFRTPAVEHRSTPCVVLGASFTPANPQRLLDTRSAVGVPTSTPVGPGETVVLDVPTAASAVVLNVTVTQPSTRGFLTVYEGFASRPLASTLNFSTGQTIANLVTVPTGSGKVAFYNGSAGTTHVIADVAGYYANAGNGFAAVDPVRVLDTRAALGVPGTTPVAANGKLTLDLSGRVPAGTTSVALNLTVTSPTNGGLIAAYPPGAAVPTVSNLNFLAGETANNMVIAPVVDGKVAFAHTGKGTVHLLADLAGWFGPGATGTYLPTAPTRLVDTRETGVVVGPGQTVRVSVDPTVCDSHPCPRTAVVANLTVTNTKSSGFLAVYPYGQERPTVSQLNFTAGETVANLFTVGLGQDSFLVYNGGKGNVDVLVDQAGFYLATN
ncbi:hypothetical protein [Asanoa siamensis]|uniref:Right handed beta helix region n=1 Tax=Asanoa siamensis TaxID=926357 RepID=A0ABQ4CTW4_9ACTN|nr:hypothetical protein [Asanoa siamensis]GIF74287.1 hypothetical protein Asi02nite_38050 [Asanoa siamensis]